MSSLQILQGSSRILFGAACVISVVGCLIEPFRSSAYYPLCILVTLAGAGVTHFLAVYLEVLGGPLGAKRAAEQMSFAVAVSETSRRSPLFIMLGIAAGLIYSAVNRTAPYRDVTIGLMFGLLVSVGVAVVECGEVALRRVAARKWSRRVGTDASESEANSLE